MTQPSTIISRQQNMQVRRKILAVASGKGGVGKTWFSITLTHALARAGHRALLFDGDLGMANVDVQLGLDPVHDMTRVITGRLAMADAIHEVAEGGFAVLAGRSGSGGLATMTPRQADSLGRALSAIAPNYDRVILDLAAGIDGTVRALATHAGVGIVVVNDEPTSMTDAYAFIKITKQKRPDTNLRVVVNQARSHSDGERTYGALRKACESFLHIELPLLGVVRRDPWVSESIRRQTPLLARNPNAPAAQDV
jgi:flagellar biosynthesis protein FlhG